MIGMSSADLLCQGGKDTQPVKADIDLEIERYLRPQLLSLLAVEFWGEETGQVYISFAG